MANAITISGGYFFSSTADIRSHILKHSDVLSGAKIIAVPEANGQRILIIVDNIAAP